MACEQSHRSIRAVTPEQQPDKLRVVHACLAAQRPHQRAGDPLRVV